MIPYILIVFMLDTNGYIVNTTMHDTKSISSCNDAARVFDKEMMPRFSVKDHGEKVHVFRTRCIKK